MVLKKGCRNTAFQLSSSKNWLNLLVSIAFLFVCFYWVIWFPEYSDKWPLSIPRSTLCSKISNVLQAYLAHSMCHWRGEIFFIYTVIWNVYLEYAVYQHVQCKTFIRPANMSRYTSSIKLSDHFIKYCDYLFLVLSSHLIRTCLWILSASNSQSELTYLRQDRASPPLLSPLLISSWSCPLSCPSPPLVLDQCSW